MLFDDFFKIDHYEGVFNIHRFFYTEIMIIRNDYLSSTISQSTPCTRIQTSDCNIHNCNK